MRMASSLQGYFVAGARQLETYICGKSGTIVAFDRRVAQLRDTTLTFFDDWHGPRSSEPDKNIIIQKLKDTLAADIDNSSRT